MSVVRACDSLVLAHYLYGLIYSIASAVHSNSLQGITNPVVLLVLATVELHKRGAVSAVEAGVFT